MIRSLTGVTLVALLAVTILITGCGQATPSAAPSGQSTPTTAVTVQTAQVQRGALSDDLTYSGNVQARQQVNIIPKASGRVTKVAVDLGSVVNAGDVLLEIEKETIAAQVAQAEAGLAAAQARLDGLVAGPRAEQVGQAEANLRAAQARLDQLKAGPTQAQLDAAEAQVRLAKDQLYATQTAADAALGSRLPNTFTKEQKEAQSGVAYEQIMIAEANLAGLKAGPTPEQLAQAQAAVDAAAHQLALAKQPVTQHDIQAARAAVDQAKAAVELAKLQLAETTVKAPFAGVISQRLVSEGAMVGPTSPVVVLMSTETQVVINVDERTLANVATDQAAIVTTSTYPGQEFAATVVGVAPTIDPRSRTGQVKLAPRDPDGKLRDGMFAQVRLNDSGARADALLVPASAVTQEGADSIVYVIADGIATRQVVVTGTSDGEHTEIVDGLSEGQVVATSNLTSLHDGAQVVTR